MLRGVRGMGTCPLSCVPLLLAQGWCPGLSEGPGEHRNFWRRSFPPISQHISWITQPRPSASRGCQCP